MGLLSGKVAIITGASSGVGRAAAKLFASEGAAVVLGARRKQALEEVLAEVVEAGAQGAAIPGDVGDEPYAKELVEAAQRRFGGLDIAFNNAGTLGAQGDLPSLSLEGWESTLRTNLTGPFLGAKYQLPALVARGAGSLIFTSTFVGYSAGFPGMAAYAASKSALVGLTQVLAAEYGPKHIRVNALLPGGIDTPMGRASASTPEALDFVRSLHAMKRIAEAEEIAKSALYLASDLSSFVTGTAHLADGGMSINKT